MGTRYKLKSRIVCGVGINDVDYETQRFKLEGDRRVCVWRCPYYEKWYQMLRRCYSKNRETKFPNYKGCTVHEDWFLFSNFKGWMEQQEWEGRHLDKDFLVEDNKIYSENTCIFLPQNLNKFITTCKASRGLYPIGVSYRNKSHTMQNERKRCFIARCHNQTGKSLILGCYYTEVSAHEAFLKKKLQICNNYIESFKEEDLVVKGLTRIRDKIQYHIDNNLELTSF